jgi:hypothetical protein
MVQLAAPEKKGGDNRRLADQSNEKDLQQAKEPLGNKAPKRF